jgi:hypothetical protein
MESREEAAAFIARMAEHMALLAVSMVIAEASAERKSKRV